MKKLEELINELTLLKVKGDLKRLDETREEIQKQLDILCRIHKKFHINVKSNAKCEECGDITLETFRLPCWHDLCKTCILKQLKSISDEKMDRRIYNSKCPKCKEFLTLEFMQYCFGEQQLLDWEEEAKRKETKFTCPICFEEKGVERECVTYDCNHQVCEECSIMWISGLINEGKVLEEQLVCPACQETPINPNTVVRLAMTAGLYDRLVVHQLQDQVIQKEIFKSCPKCSGASYIPINLVRFTCPYCNITICPNCNQPPHKGPCGAFAISPELQNLGYFACPRCSCPIEKASGCNFITCQSPSCKGKTYFCYLCKAFLTKEDHYKHFSKYGPFGKYCCNTMPSQQSS